MKRVLLLAVLVVPFLMLGSAADAHPLGNFTVNQYSGLRIHEREIVVDYVLDMAEVPTFQARSDIDIDGDGTIARPEEDSYRRAECDRIRRNIDLRVDGARADLRIGASRVRFPPGAADLATLRLECRLVAGRFAPSGSHVLRYANRNFEGRVGWQEITADGDGASLLRSDVPARSISDELRHYPDDLLASPVDVGEASVRFRPGGGSRAGANDAEAASSLLPRGVDGVTQAFVSLVARRQLTFAFGVVAVALAIVLGAIHAFGPGHGKTVMAAYLVGQRGSLRQGAVIGLTVTATHTAGVLAIGIALSTSATFLPERLYPLLGLVSGAMLLAIGLGLLRRAVRRQGSSVATPHEHGGHSHEHGGHRHQHGDHSHVHIAGPDTASRRSLLAMGFAGGLVPSPSALVVLLGAIALHRAWFGVILVVAYGVGMAAALTGAGLLLVRARMRLDRRAPSRRFGRLFAVIPVASASVVCVLGLVLAIRAAIAI